MVSVPQLRVSFVWSTLKSLQRGNNNNNKKDSELIVRSINKAFWWLAYYAMLLLFPSSTLHHADSCIRSNCFSSHQSQSWTGRRVGTYTGSSPPTSCLRFQGSTSACARTPVDHLAQKRRTVWERTKEECLHEYLVTVQFTTDDTCKKRMSVNLLLCLLLLLSYINI